MRILGYLSGAPRVSTHDYAEETGPRSHVLGIINAFERKNWVVRRFIVGDDISKKWVGANSAEKLSRNYFSRLSADLVRLSMSLFNSRKAIKSIGQVNFVYERLSAFQAIGRNFQLKGVPWILETNALLFKEASKDRKSMVLTRVAKRIELDAYKKCDILVCVSKELKRIILENVDIPEDKFIILPNGVDLNRFSPQFNHSSSQSEIPVIGFVGLIAKYQGLETLLRALAGLREKNIHYRLEIVGDGPERENLEALSSELHLRDRVTFTGRIPWEKIPDFIAGFDLCYSGQEPIESTGSMYLSPLKIYEYGAMAKPIIASVNEDAIKLIDQNTGYLFKGSDIISLQSTLIDAYKEKANWKLKGKSIRKIVEIEHSWDTRIEELINFLQNSGISTL